MFKTNASIRRFLMGQKQTVPNVPSNIWDRYENYVWAEAKDEYPKTVKEWMED